MKYKYANYKYHGKNINNLGDHIHVWTIDYLYKCMGIDKKDIVYIDIDELKTYDGPSVKLPVSLPLINYCENGIAGMFSEKIEPIFFGLTMPRKTLMPQEVEYYKRHQPIGCRDEQAYNTLKKYNIEAYLGGCLTVALPKRDESEKKYEKIFIVDIPEKLKEHIPKEIEKEAVYGTHIYYDYIENPSELSLEKYKTYWNDAKLVITGLLHASIPCLAFGIPVILARDYISYRFAWTEALLPLYNTSNYDEIDWNPKSIEIENHKDVIKKLFSKRMKNDDSTEEIRILHDFYMNRKKNQYCNDVFLDIQNFIDTNWIDKNKRYEYAVWGLTQMAELTVEYISENYPNAILTNVYDKKEGLTLRGKEAISPEFIAENCNETVFVTTVSAANVAEEYFKRIGKHPNMYKTLKIIR